MLLNNREITEEVKEEIKKYLKTNDNEKATTQNLRDAAKAVLRGKFISVFILITLGGGSKNILLQIGRAHV